MGLRHVLGEKVPVLLLLFSKLWALICGALKGCGPYVILDKVFLKSNSAVSRVFLLESLPTQSWVFFIKLNYPY